jgi:hypothetical protein
MKKFILGVILLFSSLVVVSCRKEIQEPDSSNEDRNYIYGTVNGEKFLIKMTNEIFNKNFNVTRGEVIWVSGYAMDHGVLYSILNNDTTLTVGMHIGTQEEKERPRDRSKKRINFRGNVRFKLKNNFGIIENLDFTFNYKSEKQTHNSICYTKSQNTTLPQSNNISDTNFYTTTTSLLSYNLDEKSARFVWKGKVVNIRDTSKMDEIYLLIKTTGKK